MTRVMAIWGGALLASLLCAAAAAPTELDCTNTTSGAQWRYNVDWTKSTINRKPAVITDSLITWQDTEVGPNYSFDRSSGVMTKIVASSTGGGILYDQCALK